MMGKPDDHLVESALTDLVRDYDKQWSSLDFVGLADLWVREQPQPIYVGDEYAAPLIGNDELDRHWARVAGRLKAASVSSTLHEFDVVDDTVVWALLLSRWRLTSGSQTSHGPVPAGSRGCWSGAGSISDLSPDGVAGVFDGRRREVMELNVRPVPIPDPVTQFFWDSAKRGKLSVQGFDGTDILQHPPSPVPEVPGGAEGTPVAVEVSGRGTLFAFTILHQPFHPGFVDAVPMIIGLTELDDAPGVRILTNIVEADPDELRCGLPMEVVFEEREEFALPQFRPRR
jgi:uncharacterized OB-fold protein